MEGIRDIDGDLVSVLRKMYSWTRPGGYIVIQDFHTRTVNIYPKLEAFLELWGIILGIFERACQDVEFAFKLPTYFVQAGIGAPDGTAR